MVLESLKEVPKGALRSKGLLRVHVRVRVRMRAHPHACACACACACARVRVCVACPKTDQFATSNINTNNQ